MSCLILFVVQFGLPPGSNAMRVEEDWELVLNEPDSNVGAPQFHSLISPFGHTNALHAQITWNYREVPYSSSGGLQLQAWNGDNFLVKKNANTNELSTISETVTWTQRLKTTGSTVSVSIENGQSTTWGTFGGSSMTLSGTYSLSNLNAYDPDFSLQNSWITYGDNRVQMLRIKEVRWYDTDDNLIATDNSPRVVHSQ